MTSSSGRSLGSSLPLFLIVAYFALSYILFPLYSLFRESLLPAAGAISINAYRDLLRPSLFEATFNSLLISLLSVLGSALVGTFLAYVLHFVDFRGKSFLARVLLVPLALPPLVGVISFLFLIGESGMLSRILSWLFGVSTSFFTVSGWTGIVLVHIYSFYVYFYLFVSSALSQLDGNSLDASASLGATRLRTIRRILLPMLTPSLVAASLMTFMACMASFSAPLLFGGSTRFLTLEIYTAKLNGDNSGAAATAILLTLISILMLMSLRWWQSRNRYLMETKGAGRPSSLRHAAVTQAILIFVTVGLALLFALPIVTIVVLSFVTEGSWTYQIFPHSFTAMNYGRLFYSPNLLTPLMNSVLMAIAATIVVALVGVMASYLVVRKRFVGKKLLDLLLTLPYGIPGTVIAVGLILSFNHSSFFSFQTILTGTVWIMPIAYAVRNLPLLYRSTTAGLEGLSPSLYEAAEVLGSSGARTFRTVVLPLILPSILSGALLVFINSAGEFVSSILLYSYDTKPISVEILSQLRLFNIGGAAVCSTLLMALVLIAVAASRRIFKSALTM